MKEHLHPRRGQVELDATKVPTEIDIAWSAGIFEGEGTARLCGRGKRSFAMAVAQKDPELLYRLRDWFGGSVGFHWSRYSGEKYKLHTWNICGDRARVFMGLVYPFLTTRRKNQADATKWSEFLEGRNPEGMSINDLKNRLLAFYEERRHSMWRGNSDSARLARRIYGRHQARKYRQRKREALANEKVVSIAS